MTIKKVYKQTNKSARGKTNVHVFEHTNTILQSQTGTLSLRTGRNCSEEKTTMHDICVFNYTHSCAALVINWSFSLN